MTDLSRIGDRDALKPRRQPYWHRLRRGCYLGYRPSRKGPIGSWIARAYNEETRSYRLRAMGDFGRYPARERFGEAKTAAEAFHLEIELGCVADPTLVTVEDACRLHAQQNPEAAQRFQRFVYSDPLAKVKLAKLRRSQVKGWRYRLEMTPALVSRNKKNEPVTRPRSPATVNRDMAVLRVALGKVLALGTPNTEAAWQEALKPVKNAVRRRLLYLNRDERRSLVDGVNAETRPFVTALCMLPLRPGAVAALTAGDFDRKTGELTILKDKSGARRRILLPPATAKFFDANSKGKHPSTPLFTRSNGKPWDRNYWNVEIAAAAKAAALPAGVTAYTLRHSTITDLVGAGLPLLTIAQISGTSAEMIEKHYGHLISRGAVDALATLAL